MCDAIAMPKKKLTRAQALRKKSEQLREKAERLRKATQPQFAPKAKREDVNQAAAQTRKEKLPFSSQ